MIQPNLQIDPNLASRVQVCFLFTMEVIVGQNNSKKSLTSVLNASILIEALE